MFECPVTLYTLWFLSPFNWLRHLLCAWTIVFLLPSPWKSRGSFCFLSAVSLSPSASCSEHVCCRPSLAFCSSCHSSFTAHSSRIILNVHPRCQLQASTTMQTLIIMPSHYNICLQITLGIVPPSKQLYIPFWVSVLVSPTTLEYFSKVEILFLIFVIFISSFSPKV